MDKEETIRNFMKEVFASTSNRAEQSDNELEDLFGENSPFRVVCKCGSAEIDIISIAGVMYSKYTGYQEGETVIKCRKCGAAFTIEGP